MFSRYPFVVLYLAQAALAARWLTPPTFCVMGCNEALGIVPFADAPVGGFYPQECKSQLRYESTSLCAKLYCTPDDIVAGFDEMQRICKEYANTDYPPYKPHSNLSKNELRQMALQSKQISLDKPLNQSFIPDPVSFGLAERSIAVWNVEILRQYTYSWALSVFWLGVIAIAFANKVVGSLVARRASRKRFDEGNENQSSESSPNILSSLRMKLNRYLLTPATIGSRSVQPYGWWTVPPLLESIIIFLYVALNLILCCVNYEPFTGNYYWSEPYIQLWRYVSDRTGVLSFGNLPLLWLFGTRNNFLLWLTDWTPSTFNNYHRWIARVCVVQAVIHSIGYTVEEFDVFGKEAYYQIWTLRYWWTGALATVVMCLLLPFSVLPLRQYFYDFFLLSHIVLSVVTLVGCFYHVKIFSGNYDQYLWATTAVWLFDRLLRIVRLVLGNITSSKTGERVKATYSAESDMISIDVTTNTFVTRSPGTYYYIYLLHGVKFWESHPFTCSWGLTAAPMADSSSGSDNSNKDLSHSVEKSLEAGGVTVRANRGDKLMVDESRLRFFLRPAAGFTGRLRDIILKNEASGNKQLRLFVEGPYGNPPPVHHYPHVLFIIGGSGITVALQSLQFLLKESNANRKPESVHVVWAVRQTWLLATFGDEMRMYEEQLGAKITLHATGDRSFSVGSLKDQDDLEIAGWTVHRGRPQLHEVVRTDRDNCVGGSLAVVGCCPPQMADDTRQACVSAMHETNLNIDYFQESFSW